MSYITKPKSSAPGTHMLLSSKPKDSNLLKKQNIIITTSLASKVNSNTNSNEQLVNKSTNSFRQQGIMNKFKTTKNSPDKKIDRNFSDEKGKVVLQSNAVVTNPTIITNYEKYHQNTATNQTNTTNNSNNFTTSNQNINSTELDLLKKKLFKKTDKAKNPLNFTSKTHVSAQKIMNDSQNKSNLASFQISNLQKSVDTKKEVQNTTIK
jgi:hypothetical protein